MNKGKDDNQIEKRKQFRYRIDYAWYYQFLLSLMYAYRLRSLTDESKPNLNGTFNETKTVYLVQINMSLLCISSNTLRLTPFNALDYINRLLLNSNTLLARTNSSKNWFAFVHTFQHRNWWSCVYLMLPI